MPFTYNLALAPKRNKCQNNKGLKWGIRVQLGQGEAVVDRKCV